VRKLPAARGTWGVEEGVQEGNLDRVSSNGEVVVSWEEQAARVFEA
jgi:hypothetical protein